MAGLGAPELIVIAVIIIALFGWKRLPDMARSLGRSARVFKSEVDEMKKDGKPATDASQTTVRSDVVSPDSDRLTSDNARENERLAAEARAQEAEAAAARARAEADRFRSDPSL
jgi:sec-independent protein translocase protein TatA